MMKTATGLRGRCWTAFCLALLLTACGGRVDLQRGLSDEDANDIVALLRNHSLTAEKHAQKEGFSVSIEEADMGRAVSLLRANGLPKSRYDRMGDVFKKEGMISTPLEERARYLYALSQELEHTLAQIDGVVVARVHVVLPDRVAPGEPLMPSSAAVFIKHQRQFDPDIVLPRVRELVASSIPGLASASKEKISVVFIPAEVVVEGARWQMVGPFQVAESSVAPLQGTLIAMVLLALGAMAGAVWWRRGTAPVFGQASPATPDAKPVDGA